MTEEQVVNLCLIILLILIGGSTLIIWSAVAITKFRHGRDDDE